MSGGLIVDLADCTRFRQTVAARPPRVVHGAVLLLVGLLVAAAAWAAIVQANLVVRTTGRVRSVEVPARIFAPAFTDLAGRVVEAPFEEGDFVSAGDLLVRLDTAQLDNRIAKLQRTLAAAEEELRMLAGVERLLDGQLTAAREKATAELAQAEAALVRAQDQRTSAIRSAEAVAHAARDVVARLQRLQSSRAVTAEQLVKATAELSEAQEKLVAAKLPVDEGPVEVARKAIELVDRDFAVRSAEALARRVAKEGEAAAVRKDIRQLELQRAESVLRSPIDGIVVAGQIDEGDVLAPGKPVMEIAPREGYRFEATIASEDVGHVQAGMPVRIRFDAYDYQRYGVMTGTVTYLSPDSQLPRSNEEGSAASPPGGSRKAPAMYLVRIRMDGEVVGRGEWQGAVKLGLGGAAEIVTDRESLLKIFFRKIRQTISLS
ncbi:MAG: HlyD family efflux transporter periplasmic adaptor subunit [Pirellulales bacterium]|nr:HlyD family efflux transporter periplasmic adaptor subunit [Pirellulales bacterium]